MGNSMCFRFFFLGEPRRRYLCQHIENEFEIGHIVPEILFLQAFQGFVFLHGQSRPRFRHVVCEYCVFEIRFHAAGAPFVGELLSDLDGAEPLTDPLV